MASKDNVKPEGPAKALIRDAYKAHVSTRSKAHHTKMTSVLLCFLTKGALSHTKPIIASHQGAPWHAHDRADHAPMKIDKRIFSRRLMEETLHEQKDMECSSASPLHPLALILYM